MGFDGSMSLSLLEEGRLWGLVVLHHRGPHRVAPAQRAAAMAMADAFAMRLGSLSRRGSEQARLAEQGRVAALGRNGDIHRALSGGEVTFASLFRASGAAVVEAERVTATGTAPRAAGAAGGAAGRRRPAVRLRPGRAQVRAPRAAPARSRRPTGARSGRADR